MALVKDKTYYTYNDVTIMPCIVSDIKHRNECKPFDANQHLPLFTAPMDTVVNGKNFDLFEKNNIYAILPRTEPLKIRVENAVSGRWTAFSLDEFENIFCREDSTLYIGNQMRVLIDVANGHMQRIFDLAKTAKSIWSDKIILMGGNIANPDTYAEYARAGFYAVRVGIGGGRACITSTQTAIHTPLASLIHETYEVKQKLLFSKDGNGNYIYEENDLPKIIADGGIRNYSDIIKALALGSDYVMVGSVFTRMLESAAPKRSETVGEVTDEMVMSNDMKCINGQWTIGDEGLGEIYATFYGMASREGQIALSGAKTKTSEGLKTSLRVEYTMSGWVTNFTDYLRSAMSYAGTKTLDFFALRSKVIINSPNAVNAVNK